MSIEQYQRTVNALDKDIADLEKKKAALDKKAAEEQRKAANITINKNASTATVRSKLQQRDNYLAAANKASGESATLCKIPVRHGKRAERARRKGAVRGAVVRRRGCSVCLGRCGVHHSVESIPVLRGQEHSGRSVCEHEIVGGLHHESGWG